MGLISVQLGAGVEHKAESVEVPPHTPHTSTPSKHSPEPSAVGVGVSVGGLVFTGSGVIDAVGAAVLVKIGSTVGIWVGGGAGVYVFVGTGVKVLVNVGKGVGVAAGVLVAVAVEVGVLV